jgi:cyclopropane-fatty-acyl-phospholipid synthase
MKKAIRDIAQAMHKAAPEASFAVRFWDDDVYAIGDDPAFTLRFNDKRAASRTLADGFMGFGESYMDGSLDVEGDMQLLFRLGFVVGYTEHAMSLGLKLRVLALYFLKQNTLSGSRKNIRFHYDVGNDFFERLLGPTMAYTCAYYAEPSNTLDQAQTNKFDLVCRKLRLREGEHIADLGCGWGGLLIHAAWRYGITGVGVTVSEHQYDFANRKIAELGLQDRIQVQLRDYRKIEGTYDKVVSVGLMEHVGSRFISRCFAKIREILKPRSLALVHTVGTDVPRKADPWTDKYMFPGAQAPAISHLIDGIGRNRMNVIDVENLRLHYEQTVFHWLENLHAQRDWIRDTYDESFLRRYRLYLEVSASSFRHGDNRLFQVLFTNGLSDLVPMTRNDIYWSPVPPNPASAARTSCRPASEDRHAELDAVLGNSI